MKFSDTEYGDLTGQDITISAITITKMGMNDLTGSPEIVRGDFSCPGNRLTTLKNSPREIYGNAYFTSNKLTSLEGDLEIVVGNLDVSFNPLKSFKGSLRKVTGRLFVDDLPEFHSLKEIEEALIEANVTVGGSVVTDFGTFKQDPKSVQIFHEKHRIDILGEFL